MNQTGSELHRLLSPLRRALSRSTPVLPGAGRLSEAQIDLLRTVAHHGPLTTTQLAAQLHVARPTVSNLVKPLSQGGLLEREPSPDDFRSTLIRISPRARRLLAETDEDRDAILQHALNQLGPADRQAIAAALPALASLLENLRGESVERRRSRA